MNTELVYSLLWTISSVILCCVPATSDTKQVYITASDIETLRIVNPPVRGSNRTRLSSRLLLFSHEATRDWFINHSQLVPSPQGGIAIPSCLIALHSRTATSPSTAVRTGSVSTLVSAEPNGTTEVYKISRPYLSSSVIDYQSVFVS